VKPLIANARQAQVDWFKKTGVFPINNVMVVRDEVLAANPGIAEALFAAYKQAKSLYMQRLKAQGAKSRDEEADQRYSEIVGDPLPVGLAANRKALETIAQYSYDQGVIGKPVASIDALFAPSTRALS